jgi:hypothetical protein
MILLMTVPHSGTHFMVQYLSGVLGLVGRNCVGDKSRGFVTPDEPFDYAHIHPSHRLFSTWHPWTLTDVFDTAIVTLRHPLRSAATQKANHGQVEMTAESWEALIDEIPKYKKIVYVAIDGPKERRLPDLLKVADLFGVYHEGIEAYAEKWIARNASPANIVVRDLLSQKDVNRLRFATRKYEECLQ